MKIAIPLDESMKDICISFGRAPFFLLSDEENREIFKNPASDESNGAGICAAQFLVDHGAAALVTARCGKNAADIFKASGIIIYKADGFSVDYNLSACAEGKLEELNKFHAGFHGGK